MSTHTPRLAALGLLVSMLAPAGPAVASQELLVQKNCLACHQIDKRKYGPTFKEVAARYAGQKNATELLARKIRRGGTGVWGQDVMPAQPQVSAAEAKTLAAFVLSLN
jgi:cytochrome c